MLLSCEPSRTATGALRSPWPVPFLCVKLAAVWCCSQDSSKLETSRSFPCFVICPVSATFVAVVLLAYNLVTFAILETFIVRMRVFIVKVLVVTVRLTHFAVGV